MSRMRQSDLSGPETVPNPTINRAARLGRPTEDGLERIELQLMESGMVAVSDRDLLTVTDDPDEVVRILSASYDRSCREGTAGTHGTSFGTGQR